MTNVDDFRAQYAAALGTYLAERGEARLAVGHELGRRALSERISMLEIVENHFRLVDKVAANNGAAALQFLLQTLAALDVATRGFLDGTRRYEEERARAEGLADRDEFRSALVNALQEGFFVADNDGAVVEINEAFVEITGYPPDGLPYRWPYPWIVDDELAGRQLARLRANGNIQSETEIRHRNGRIGWAAVSINAVPADGSVRDAYVGTIRDITTARAATGRTHALMRLATAVGLAKSVSEVLAITLEECRSAVDLRRVTAVMWSDNDGEPTVQAAGEPAVTSWRDLGPALQELLRSARGWPPLTVEPVVSAAGPGMSSGVVARLPGTGDVVLLLEHKEPRRTSADGRLLITALVGHLGLAMQHVHQFEAAREASLTLQRAMLPTTRPPVGFAVRYEPAVAPFEIGGDWYDVLSISDHEIGIIVGDCVGRGLPAAAVMGQLRSSARALLLTGADPGVLLEELDSAAALIPDAYCATVFLAILDTESGVLRYSNAGHVPAVLAAPQRRAVLLTEAGSVPLAVKRTKPRPQAMQVLPAESTLMLFTDGLVERRDKTIDAGIERVTEVLTGALSEPADAVADAVLRELAPPGGYDDDVAILVYRRSPGPLRIEIAAIPEHLAEVRARLSAWLAAAGAPEELTTDIVLAVNEACTNSVEHAYRDRPPGVMRVDGDVRGAQISLTVVDFGRWKPPDAHPRIRGRGLPMMRAVSDRVEVDTTTAGTTVELAFALQPTDGDE